MTSCSSGDDTADDSSSVVAFPEVGLEITLPSTLSDLTYAMGEAEEGQPAIFFSTQKLASVGGPTCSAGATSAVSPFPLGQIVVADETPEHVREESKDNPSDRLGRFVKQVGEKYLYYDPPPAERCVSDRKAAQLQREQTAELRPAFASLRAAEE